jgi:hypothetical protein
MHPRIRELLDHLDSQRAILRAAFDAVPAAARDRSPAPDRWSPAGIVEHLAIVEQRVGPALAARIASARADGVGVDTSSEPVLPTLDLERVVSRTTRVNAPEMSHPSGLDAETAWAALERAGTAVRETLRSADGLALGTITHPHPFFEALSLYEWFALIGSHEARHAAQIREIVEVSAAHDATAQPS